MSSNIVERMCITSSRFKKSLDLIEIINAFPWSWNLKEHSIVSSSSWAII